MKKFLIIALSAAICLAVATPAAAKISMAGMLTTDFFYLDQNEERAGGNGADSTTFTIPQALNRFTMKYASDDNAIRGYVQLRGGSGTGRGASEEVIWNFAWIDWQLTPAQYLRFGKQTQAFAIMAPQQFLGQSAGHIVGAGYGNVHGGTSRIGARWYIKFSDAARLEVQLLDPDNDSAETIAGSATVSFVNVTAVGGTALVKTVTTSVFPVAGTGVLREETKIPRLDVALPLTFGNWVIEPSGTYLTQSYDEVGSGAEDDITIWGLCAGIRFGAGMFSFAGEITYGQNLTVGNYVGAGTPPSGGIPNVNLVPIAFTDAAGNLQIEDVENLSFWAQIGLKLGPSTIYGIYGQNNQEADPLGVTFEIERKMYGLSWPISIVKGMTIRPELMWYDQDTKAQLAGLEANLGKEWVFGVQTMLVF